MLSYNYIKITLEREGLGVDSSAIEYVVDKIKKYARNADYEHLEYTTAMIYSSPDLKQAEVFFDQEDWQKREWLIRAGKWRFELAVHLYEVEPRLYKREKKLFFGSEK